MMNYAISPVYFGEFTQSEVRQLRLGYELLIDMPTDNSLTDIRFLMHFSRGNLETILKTPNALKFKSPPPRIVFAYCLDEDSNANVSSILNDAPQRTYLARVNTALVRDLSISSAELVSQIASALFMRPFDLSREQVALDQFGFSVSVLAVQLVFLHEYSHCTRNHLDIWCKVLNAQSLANMSEALNASELLISHTFGQKARIRRALELDADIEAARIIGALYHYHVIGPNAIWFGKLTERHKLLVCWIAVIAAGIAFCRLQNRDSLYYHSPLMRALDMISTIFQSTRKNAEDIKELYEDLHFFLSMLNDGQNNKNSNLIPSEDYLIALPTADQLQTQRDLERLKKMKQIRDA